MRSGISLRLKCHQTLFLVFLLCRNLKKLFCAVKLIKLFFMTSRIVYYVFKDHPHFRVIFKKSSHVFLYIFDPSGSYFGVRDQVQNNDFFFFRWQPKCPSTICWIILLSPNLKCCLFHIANFHMYASLFVDSSVPVKGLSIYVPESHCFNYHTLYFMLITGSAWSPCSF